MSKSFADRLNEDRRLAILQLLFKDPGYSHNDGVLHTALESLGHKVSRDAVRTDLAWLAEQGLVAVEEVGKSIRVATLSERGGDVAAGRVIVPGVKRPSPGAG